MAHWNGEIDEENYIEIGEKVYVADVQLNEVFEGFYTEEGVRLFKRHPIYNFKGYGKYFSTKEKAENYLKNEINSFKKVIEDKGAIEILFRTWANEYPEGQLKTDIEAMKEVLKEKYGVII